MAGWTAPKQSAESQVSPSLWSEESATFSPHQQLLSTPYLGDFPPPPSSLSWPPSLCISLSPIYLVYLFSTQKPLSSNHIPLHTRTRTDHNCPWVPIASVFVLAQCPHTL